MCNSRGFAALPTELLNHVASHIQGTALPWYRPSYVEGQRNERRDALRALSQLSRSLRNTFLPLFWQNLEVYNLVRSLEDDQLHIEARIKAVGKELLGQLTLVRGAKQPYASYVRVITVAIHSESLALTKLTDAMTLMPNLHTIKIVCDSYGGRFNRRIEHEQFQKAFSSLTFPSVKRAIIPGYASAIFGCFPEAVEVFTNQPISLKFIDDMFSHCPKIKTFGWRMNLYTGSEYGSLKRFPNLRRIECYMTFYNVDEIMQLLPLNLEKITLVCDADSKEPSQIVEAARQVLAKSSFPSKCLEVIVGNERRTIDIRDKPS